jgi:DNA-binding LytR/AlgR family response regulator
MVLLLYWGVVVFLTLQIAKSKNQIKKLVSAMAVVPDESHEGGLAHPNHEERFPKGSLRLSDGNGNGTIKLADITHITVEDHYCRVSYSAGNRLKNIMIRLPLKEMMSKLPREHFMQTHPTW